MKSAVIFQTTAGQTIPTITEDALERFRYKGCGPADAYSIGFSENSDGVLISNISGLQVMHVTVQEKKINKHHLDKLLKEEDRKTQELFSRGMSKTQKIAFLEEATIQLLMQVHPQAPKTTTLFLNKEGLLVVEGSAKFADDITELLRNANGSLPVIPVQVATDIVGKLTSLIEEGTGETLALGEKAKLITEQELSISASAVNMTDSTVHALINEGAIVLELELELEGTHFSVKEDFTLAGFKFPKELLADTTKGDRDTAMLLMREEVNKIIFVLIAEFGGFDKGTQ